jgi:uncharacterized protein YndB with AHSA1/START domain
VKPDLDLGLERTIRAPRATVWRAWTDPSWLEQWWVPAPSRCRVDRLDLRPGGAFVTRLSDDGAEIPPSTLQRRRIYRGSAFSPYTPPLTSTDVG